MARIPAHLTMGALAFALIIPQAVRAQDAERHVFVTVLDRDGTPVTGLTTEHFAVREGGRDRPVVDVQPLATPMHVAVLVDLSFSPGLPIDAFRTAVGDFVERLAAFHHVALYSFAGRPSRVVAFTRDAAQLRGVVANMFALPETRTYLLDAVELVLNDLKPIEPARPVIVAFTTENIDASTRTAAAVMKQLVATSTAFHAVQLATDTGATTARPMTPDRDIPARSQQLGRVTTVGEGDRERNRLLDQGTSLTGGSRQRIMSITALGSPLARLASEFAYSYRLTFDRPGRDTPLRDLQIGLLVDGVTVRAVAAPHTR